MGSVSLGGGIFLSLGVWRLVAGTNPFGAVTAMMAGIVLLAFAWLRMQR